MDNTNHQIGELYARWVSGSATKQETELLFQLLRNHEDIEGLLKPLLKKTWQETENQGNHFEEKHPAILSSILKSYPGSVTEALPENKAKEIRRIPNHRFRLSRIWAAAAVLILLLGAGIYFFHLTEKNHNKAKQPLVAATNEHVIKPGSDGAILTLSDGRTIVLDSADNGTLALQNGTQVEVVLRNGEVSYNAKHEAEITGAYNTMSTPKGRQFRLILPDGTRIWLNAESSITFPPAFAGNERTVKVSGEVFFDVAPDKNRPFRVQTPYHTTIEVLGTQFNINSYADETEMVTTLLEGSVRVYAEKETLLLTPGQQAVWSVSDKNIRTVSDADTSSVIAWKNGLFRFHHDDITAVMRQLSRWYDFSVRYEGALPGKRFSGEITRDLSFDQVLEILETLNVKFSFEGNVLIVKQ